MIVGGQETPKNQGGLPQKISDFNHPDAILIAFQHPGTKTFDNPIWIQKVIWVRRFFFNFKNLLNTLKQLPWHYLVCFSLKKHLHSILHKNAEQNLAIGHHCRFSTSLYLVPLRSKASGLGFVQLCPVLRLFNLEVRQKSCIWYYRSSILCSRPPSDQKMYWIILCLRGRKDIFEAFDA